MRWQPFGQDVHQEAADELVDRQPHGLVATGSLGPIILPFEGHAGRVDGDQPAIGDWRRGGCSATDIAGRGVEFGVAQERLDDADIGTAFEQMGGEAVAQRVQRDTFFLIPAASVVSWNRRPQLSRRDRPAGVV